MASHVVTFFKATGRSRSSVIDSRGSVSEVLDGTSITSTAECPHADNGVVAVTAGADIWLQVAQNPSATVAGDNCFFLMAGITKEYSARKTDNVSVLEV